VLAADSLSLGGGTLADLSPATLAALDACLPATWSKGNPVDIIGDAPVSRYQAALRVLLAASEVDGVLFMHAPTAIVSATQIALACLPLMQSATKPVLACWLGGAVVAAARQATAAAGIASYNTPERATAAWLQLIHYNRNQQALQQLTTASVPDALPDRAGAQHLIQQALQEGREWLGDTDSQALLMAYGIPVVDTRKTADIQAAVLTAETIGYPVALKIISPQIIHKSDVGGVALGLTSAAEVKAAAETMQARVSQLRPDAVLRGFTVQAMAHRPDAHELILGINTDPLFGPVLLLGEGGTAVELHAHHAVALPPLNTSLAIDLVQRSQLTKLLGAYRGKPAANQAALLDTLLKLSLLACDLSQVAELDINPLLIDADGVLAVDSRVRIKASSAHDGSHLAIRPYPAALEESIHVAGRDVLLRPIRPEDGGRLQHFYADATPADMRLRFFMVRREVPHSELARYSQIDYDREMTFIAVAASRSGEDRMLGEVRAVCDPDNFRAEFSIQVATRWQGRGLGRLLLDKLLRYLRDRGTAEVVGECLAENLSLASLARHAGFTLNPGSSPDIIALRLDLKPPTLDIT